MTDDGDNTNSCSFFVRPGDIPKKASPLEEAFSHSSLIHLTITLHPKESQDHPCPSFIAFRRTRSTFFIRHFNADALGAGSGKFSTAACLNKVSYRFSTALECCRAIFCRTSQECKVFCMIYLVYYIVPLKISVRQLRNLTCYAKSRHHALARELRRF
jgi:hypothetical protein